MIVPTLRGLNSAKAIRAKRDYSKNERHKDHLGYRLTDFLCLGNTTPENFPQQCEDRLQRYLQFSPLIRDRDVTVRAYWAMPRYADDVRPTEAEFKFVESLTAAMLGTTIGIHNWHKPPTPVWGRSKGPDFNPMFSSVLSIGGIPVLISEREHNLRGQFCALMNYVVSAKNLERHRQGQTLIPTVADAKQNYRHARGRLTLAEQLACLPQAPGTVTDVVAGLELLGYELLPDKNQDSERLRFRPRLHAFLRHASGKRTPTLTLSLPDLTQEVMWLRGQRWTRSVEPAEPGRKTAVAPALPAVALDWNNEEEFLIGLARLAARRAKQLRLATNVMDRYAALGLQLRTDLERPGMVTLSKATPAESIQSQCSQSITLPGYRAEFVGTSAVVRDHLHTLGFTVLLPPSAGPLSAEEKRVARCFIQDAGLASGQWKETAAKLKQPQVRAVLEQEWPRFHSEPDLVLRAKRLNRALIKPGQLNPFEANRITFAVCDPLAQRLGTLGPLVPTDVLFGAKDYSKRPPAHRPAPPKATVPPPAPVPLPAPLTSALRFDWSSEEAFLRTLENNTRHLGQEISRFVRLPDQFAWLGLQWEEDTVAGTVTLRQGDEALTLPSYRPAFIVQSACIRTQLDTLGLVGEAPATPDPWISEDDHTAAKKLINFALLRSCLWGDDARQLATPRVLETLRRDWPGIQAETDPETKARRVFQTIKATGGFSPLGVIRVATAISDPLAQSLGTIQPMALGLEKVCIFTYEASLKNQTKPQK